MKPTLFAHHPIAYYFSLMENEYLSNPHDKFFKESFSHKEVVESFIREYLPETIYKQVDFGSLEILKDSFIDIELSEHFSDILYRIKIAGKFSYLYLLFEHKSYMDPMIGFQLLRNMVKILEQYLKQHKRVKKLPVIVPIVIYHGNEKWSIANSLMPLFEQIEGTKQYIPDFKSEVFDISHIPDDMIKGEIVLRVQFLIQKYINSPQLFDKLSDIFMLLVSLADNRRKTEYFETLLRYLTSTINYEKKPDLKDELVKVIEKGDLFMTTIAEKWVQEGEAKGEAKGKVEGKVEDATKMVELGMTDDVIHTITNLPLSTITEIRSNVRK